MKPGDRVGNPSLELLNEIDKQGYSVYYELIDSVPTGIVYDLKDVPYQATCYQVLCQRLAHLGQLKTFGHSNMVEMGNLLNWHELLHPFDRFEV